MNSQKVNIAYVSNFPHVRMGGQKSMLALIDNLARDKFNPFCFVPEKGELSDELEKRDCKVIYLKTPPLKPKNYGQLPTLLSNIRKEISKNDIKIIHPDMERDALIYGLATRFSDTKLVWHVRLTRPDKQDEIIFRLADKVIGISDGVSKRFIKQKKFKKKYITVFNGVNLENFKPCVDKDSIKKELNLKNKYFNVLFAGQLKTGKGIIDLFYAARNLKSDKKKVRFYLAGEALNEKDWEKFNSMISSMNLLDYVYFLGQQKNIEKWMQACDALVLPSHEGVEGMGRVMFEAMACGCIPIGSNTSGVKEAITEDSGLLIEPKNPESISKAIESLINDENKVKELSNNAIIRAQEVFDIKIHAQKVMEVYKELI